MEIREPEVIQSEVDGVPVFSVDGPRPFTAALNFRVGVFDERLPVRGITHLVEHLALYAHRETEIAFNGAVGSHLTGFWAQGHPNEVGGFLRDVCASLHDLPFDRLDVEADILQREGAAHPGTYFDQILWSYFGPFGPGVSGSMERGLEWLDPDEIRAWASRHFTIGNAALVIVGDPPGSWGLELPDGDPIPFVAPPRTRPTPASPTLFDTQEYGVTWGTMIKDRKGAAEPAFYVALEVLSKRLQDRLRHDLGQTYSVLHGWQRLDADHLAASHGFDAEPSQSREVALEHRQVITEFLEDGPTREEIDRYVRMRVKAYEDHPHDAARHQVGDEVEAHLAGWGPTISVAEWLVESEALTPERVRDRFAEAYRQSHTIADLPSGELEPLGNYFPPDDEPSAGVQFESKHWHRRKQPATVRIGPEGVALGYSDGWAVSGGDQIAMVSFEGSTITVDASRGSTTVDSSKYVKSRSLWRERTAIWAIMALLAVAAIILLVLDLPWIAFLLAVTGAMLPGLARKHDPTEIKNRSLTMQDSLRKYLPDDLILPPPRSRDGGAKGSG